MNADSLSLKSRVFYERVRTKMAVSLFFSSLSLVALGFCSAYGGQSDSANYYRKNATGDSREAYQALVGGYGEYWQLPTKWQSAEFLTIYLNVRIRLLLLFRGVCDLGGCCILYVPSRFRLQRREIDGTQ